MDKPAVGTASLEDELVGKITDLSDPAPEDLAPLIADFKQKLEDELWEAWTIAQGVSFNAEQNRLLDQKRILEEEQRAFQARTHAFNEWVRTYHKHRHSDHPEGSPERELLDTMNAEAAAALDQEETQPAEVRE